MDPSELALFMNPTDFVGKLPESLSFAILCRVDPQTLLEGCRVSKSWNERASCEKLWKLKCINARWENLRKEKETWKQLYIRLGFHWLSKPFNFHILGDQKEVKVSQTSRFVTSGALCGFEVKAEKFHEKVLERGPVIVVWDTKNWDLFSKAVGKLTEHIEGLDLKTNMLMPYQFVVWYYDEEELAKIDFELSKLETLVLSYGGMEITRRKTLDCSDSKKMLYNFKSWVLEFWWQMERKRGWEIKRKVIQSSNVQSGGQLLSRIFSKRQLWKKYNRQCKEDIKSLNGIYQETKKKIWQTSWGISLLYMLAVVLPALLAIWYSSQPGDKKRLYAH
eukprot:Nk52_evm64s2192 gene=Nk52_evmTU64s2192